MIVADVVVVVVIQGNNNDQLKNKTKQNNQKKKLKLSVIQSEPFQQKQCKPRKKKIENRRERKTTKGKNETQERKTDTFT